MARLRLGVHLDTFSADWPLPDGLVERPLGGFPDSSVAIRGALKHYGVLGRPLAAGQFPSPESSCSLSIGPQVLGVITWLMHHFLDPN